jgi:hypothetical protein
MFTQPVMMVVAYSGIMQSDTSARIMALNAHLYLELLYSYFIFWVSELVST